MKKQIVLAFGLTAALMVFGCGGGSSGGGDDADLVQRDRMGVPAVNTALIPSSMKDAFNSGDPSTDRADFFDTIVSQIEGLRAAVASVPGFPPEDDPGVPAETLATVVNPDVLRIDLSQPTVFPNGRFFSDEVIDPVLGLVLNRGNVLGGGPGISDGISNDSPTLPQFPYAAPPQ